MPNRGSLIAACAVLLVVACGYNPQSKDSGLEKDSRIATSGGDAAQGGSGGAIDDGGVGGRTGGAGGVGAAGGATAGTGATTGTGGTTGAGGATGTGGTADAAIRDVSIELPRADVADVPLSPTGGVTGAGGVVGTGGTAGTGGTTPRLAIDSFAAAPATITAGRNSTLSWTVSGATTVSIDHGVGVVAGGNSVVVSPDTTTTYTLTARDAAGSSVTAQAAVTAVPLPTITAFTADRTTLPAGAGAKLTASYSGATQASINGGVGSVSSGVPTATGPLSSPTTFTLTVVNAAGDSVTAQVTINVVPAAAISSFTAAPDAIALGTSTNLQAIFTNGTGVIDGGLGSATSGKNIATGPLSANTTFTLTVTGPAGDFVTAKVLVTVASPGSFVGLTTITPRSWHAATLLANGKVLITGGADGSGLALKSAELFDPATGTFTEAGSMLVQRGSHQATLLTNGKVLITGGPYSADPLSAELYDPATGLSAPTGAMVSRRSYHSATLLPDGKVLVAGGTDNDGRLNSAELYNPAVGTFTAVTTTMTDARQTPVAIGWPSTQKILLMGDSYPSVDAYDPMSGSFASAGALIAGRAYMTATWLQTAKVLITGGFGAPSATASAELYDPVLQASTASGAMTTPRVYHTATLLDNGRVLVVGGFITDSPPALASAELYDPTTGTFKPTGSMISGRFSHTATALPNQKVLVVGGNGKAPGAELYFY